MRKFTCNGTLFEYLPHCSAYMYAFTSWLSLASFWQWHRNITMPTEIFATSCAWIVCIFVNMTTFSISVDVYLVGVDVAQSYYLNKYWQVTPQKEIIKKIYELLRIFTTSSALPGLRFPQRQPVVPPPVTKTALYSQSSVKYHEKSIFLRL